MREGCFSGRPLIVRWRTRNPVWRWTIKDGLVKRLKMFLQIFCQIFLQIFLSIFLSLPYHVLGKYIGKPLVSLCRPSHGQDEIAPVSKKITTESFFLAETCFHRLQYCLWVLDRPAWKYFQLESRWKLPKADSTCKSLEQFGCFLPLTLTWWCPCWTSPWCWRFTITIQKHSAVVKVCRETYLTSWSL